MVEAPLFIRPYILNLTRGELFSVMTCGMATIAGTVMVLYAGVLGPVIPDAMGHLLTASIISAPAAIALARIVVPTVRGEETDANMVSPAPAENAMEAVTNGTLEGIKLVISIVAMLVVIVSLVGLREYRPRPAAGNRRRTPDPSTDAGSCHVAGHVADRHSLARMHDPQEASWAPKPS